MKMKKLSIFLLMFLSISILSGQTLDPFIQDGKIYLKFKAGETVPFAMENGVVDLKSSDFFGNLISTFGVKSVKNPFYQSKNAILDRIFLIDFSNHEGIDDFIAKLSSKKELEYVEKAPFYRVSYVPNDPDYSTAANNWHLKKIWADTAWNISKGDTNIVVAVIDNAIFVNHPDLVGKIHSAIDLADGDNNPTPPVIATGNNMAWAHGTHTSGLVAAASDNGVGIPSIGYNIRLMAIKAGKDADGGQGASHMYEGITYAADNGAHVISMSLGGPYYFETMQLIIDYAYNKGVVIVAAAGNNGDGAEDQNNINYIGYPAACNHVIAVGATNGNDKKAGFSQFGTWIDVVAPGGYRNDGGILDVVMNNSVYSLGYSSASGGYTKMQGTSMACPIVAGLCGLMLSVNPNLTPDKLTYYLKLSCDNIESLQASAHQGMVGAGRINAFKALTMVQDSMSTMVANFSANSTWTNPGTDIQFTNQSIGNPTHWLWSFEGGSPAVSTDENPLVTYDNSGSFGVTLLVWDDVDTVYEYKPNFITVATPTTGSSDWLEQATGFASMYRGAYHLSIASPQIVWAAAVDGTNGQPVNEFTKTSNGGNTWTPGIISNAPAGHAIAHINALSEDVAWIAYYPTTGAGGKVFKTADGGANWTEIPTGAFNNNASFLNVVHFFNDNDGFCMGDVINNKFELLHTNNGGASWNVVDPANNPAPLSGEMGWTGVYDVIGNNVWFATNKGRVFKSTDKGLTWTVSTTGLSDIQKITFSDELNGLVQQIAYNQSTGAISTFNTRITSDGGNTWSNVTMNGPVFKSDISAVPGIPGRFFSVGTDGGSTATRQYGSSYTSNFGANWHLIDTTIQYICVKFFDENSGWAGAFNISATSGGVYKWNGTVLDTYVPIVNKTSMDANVYPNPFSQFVKVELFNIQKGEVSAKIFDINGRLVFERNYGQRKGNVSLDFNVNNLNNGLYFLVVDAGSERLSRKIIKQ